MSAPRSEPAQSVFLPSEASDPSLTGVRSPDILYCESARRLGFLSLLASVVWGALLAGNHLVVPRLHLPDASIVPWGPAADALAVLCILLSLGLYFLTQQLWAQSRRIVILGLWYEVVLAFAIGVMNQWEVRVLAGRLSWICVLVVIFPFVVPSSPRKALIAGLAAATMDPVGLAVAAARGLPLPDFGLLVWAYLPNYACAVLAVLPAIMLARLQRQAHRARELGSYQLVELLGEGGMGQVWSARHRMLARPAAIKLIKPAYLGSSSGTQGQTMIRRFRREAEAVAGLHSHHTVHLFDFGVTGDGTCYYVMELLEGLDLDTLVHRFGPVPAERAAHLLAQACHSLADAHQSGLLHRDIKPANLYACRMGCEVDFVKVLDFGLVKSLREARHDTAPLTAPNFTAGTPAFMPPEMILGEHEDARTDLYSLGCVGYWLITGQLVFDAETPMQMMARHLQSEPVPPSRRTTVEVSPEFDRLILACLEKKPENRPADAGAMASELQRIAAPGHWTREQMTHWWDIHLPASHAAARVRGPAARSIAVAMRDGVDVSS